MTVYADYLAEDERARATICSLLQKSMLVEAGAGTGKTRSLVDRVVALILDGMPIESVVAITFTEKAAAGLRERIRGALAEELEKRPIFAQRLQTALEGLGRAAISTIHAFCLSILRSFAPEAGIDPDFAVLDEVLADRRFEERWRGYLDDLGSDPNAVQSIDRALSLGLQTRDIARLARELWNLQHLVAPLEQRPPASEKAVWPDLQQMQDELGELPLAPVAEDDRLRVAVESVIDLANRLRASPDNRDQLLSASTAVLRQTFGNRGRQTDWGGAAAIGRARDTAKQACESLSATLEALRSQSLAGLLPYIVRFVREDGKVRSREGSLIFDDLILRVRDLLQSNPSIANAFRARYQALLIDEFQDTDPRQVDIALTFASVELGGSIEPGRLFLVGDPKQSIYRFRQADMEIYAAVRVRVEGDGGLLPQLALNHRSRRVVIDAVNAWFTKLIGAGDNPELQPPYRPIHYQRDQALTGSGVATFGGPESAPALVVRRHEAAQVAARCSAMINEAWQVYDPIQKAARAAAYRDIAILIPTRGILLSLERALAARGIPYRVEGGSLIYGTQDVRDIINCLTAIDDPADEVAVVAALRSPAYACSDLDLARFRAGGGRFNYLSPALGTANGRVADALRDLRRGHEQRHALSLAVVVERLVTGRALIEIGVLDQGNRNAFRRARFLVEQARAFEARGPESLRAFVAWLERRAGTAILDYEGAGLDDDEDAVRVLTIHGAKGLEFPIVILAGLGAAEQPDTPVFGIDHGSNEVAIAIGAKSHGSRFTLGPADRVLEQERRHAAAERDRLLYVGATRARDHLLFSLFHPDRVKNSLAGRLIDHGIRATCEALPLLPDTIAAYPPPFAELLVDEPPSLDEFHDEHERLLAAYHLRYTSATALGRSGVEDVKDEREDVTEPWARGRAGTHIGRAVHAALQSVAWTAGDAEIDAVARAQAVAEAVPERAGDIARLIRRALVSDAAARARAGRALREVPFALARDGTVLEGFMDLVIDTPGGLEIVDWKTDAIPSSEVERRLETYRLQAGLYVAGLEAATGRTVSRVTYVFVSAGAEVSPGDPATLARSALARLSE